MARVTHYSTDGGTLCGLPGGVRSARATCRACARLARTTAWCASCDVRRPMSDMRRVTDGWRCSACDDDVRDERRTDGW